MPKIACRVEYNGSLYSGWQYQNHTHSIQAEVERALSAVANEKIQVVCAGRTDAGVHATAQIIHFETSAIRSDRSWLLGTNTHLAKDIAIRWVSEIEKDFHARFSAISRSYRYIIYNNPSRSALLHKMVTLHYQPLDAEAMQKAAQYLVGEHDFSSYRAAHCQANSPIREISSISVKRIGDFIYIDVSANAFLHHMIRNIVGVLMTIGCGDEPPVWTKTVLGYKDRKKAAVTARPDGLYLVRVQYPDNYRIPMDHPLPQFN